MVMAHSSSMTQAAHHVQKTAHINFPNFCSFENSTVHLNPLSMYYFRFLDFLQQFSLS